MTTDPYCPPPPYTPSDPLTPATTQGPESPLRLRGGDGHNPTYPSHNLESRSLTVDDAALAHFSSAASYFEGRGLPGNTHDAPTRHQLFISPVDRAEDVARMPLCWRNSTGDLTQADMSTFANFLLPPAANVPMPPKLRADLASDEKGPMIPVETESDDERQTRMSLVVAEWNEAFFYPRGLLVELILVPQHPPHAARGLDPICQSCVAANNSASRFAAQGYTQPVLPSMPHGVEIPPPPMFHDSATFPPALPPIPRMLHRPVAWLHDLPPIAPYGRRSFGLGQLRDGLERFNSGGGWSRGRGRGREEHYVGRGGPYSHEPGHRDLHHNRRSRSSASSSSSSSSASDSLHDHRHGGRHASRLRGRGCGRSRGRGRGRDCGEAHESQYEHHHRRRGRSSSASSSSSSSSDTSIDSISSRDVRGLSLQDVVRGIATMKLDKESSNFGSNVEELGKKFRLKMNGAGHRSDVSAAVKELKTGLREMKKQNVNSARRIGKDEKRAVKKELKGLRKDLKEQMKEIKRAQKDSKRDEKNRRVDRRRTGTDGGGCGGRRNRGFKGTEDREWRGDDLERLDMEEQVTGVTTVHDMNPVGREKDVK